jgi:hypothetical protein
VFVAAAVCPHPPLLAPPVARQAAAELDDLRTACTAAVAGMLESAPDVVICVGDGPTLRTYDEHDGGTLRGFGVDLHTGGDGSEGLPLALTMGAWLLDRAAWSGPRRYFALPQETTPQECVEMGQKIAAADLRVGVLAMGDGSARRSTQAPGYLDDRAEPFDAAVAQALAGADLEWLSGRQAWQFLAGAATQTAHDTAVAARMHYDAAPYGVGYLVAGWVADGSGIA